MWGRKKPCLKTINSRALRILLCRWYLSFLDNRDMPAGKVRQYRHEGSHVHDVNDGMGLGSLHILVSATGGWTLLSRSFEPVRQSRENFVASGSDQKTRKKKDPKKTYHG